MDSTQAQLVVSLLKLESAPNDVIRAKVLRALIGYAQDARHEELFRVATAHLPSANPFQPPEAWLASYHHGFSDVASLDCGVDAAADSDRYAREYWFSLSDQARNHRLSRPESGYLDGETDAGNLNNA